MLAGCQLVCRHEPFDAPRGTRHHARLADVRHRIDDRTPGPLRIVQAPRVGRGDAGGRWSDMPSASDSIAIVLAVPITVRLAAVR